MRKITVVAICIAALSSICFAEDNLSALVTTTCDKAVFQTTTSKCNKNFAAAAMPGQSVTVELNSGCKVSLTATANGDTISSGTFTAKKGTDWGVGFEKPRCDANVKIS